MVACNSWTLLQLPKLLYFSLMIIFFFFLILVPCATPLNFSFPTITQELKNEIWSYGSANFSEQGIQLTGRDKMAAGRALYHDSMHLWDKASGNLADFDTHFSFVIDSEGGQVYADGLAFFLFPRVLDYNTPIDKFIIDSKGAALGLPVHNSTLANLSPFVAVEFDTLENRWDPYNQSVDPHVGINVNSLESCNTSVWYGNITQGGENEAWISYSSHSKILSVSFTSYFHNTIVQQGNLSCHIDFRAVGLPELVTFGFSAATGDLAEKHTIKSWNFSSTEPAPVTLSPKPKGKTALVVGLSVGSCVLLVGGLGLIAICLRKKMSRGKQEDAELVFDPSMDDEFEQGTGPKKFSYGELVHSTKNFAEEEKLGEGGFGGVYRGFLREMASYVAVKRVSRGSNQGLKEYASEVKIISRLRHKNLVQLIGWCHEKNELLLVYELMPNGSLDSHLFKGESLLTWAMRYKIVQGLASALLYLHEEWEQCVLHRDIKSSNIMLDSNFNAKVGDFGLARLVDHEKGSQTTLLAGTMGYMAPECVITGKSSKDSDVYSFGIVALKIVCGRKPIDLRAPETQSRLVEWVWDLYGKGKLIEAADSKLCSDFDEQEMTSLLIVGLWCVHPDYNIRPSIRQVIQVLNYEALLPSLPSKMPVPTYLTLDSVTTTTSSLSLACNASVSESSQINYSSQSYNTNSSNLTIASASSSPSNSLLYTG